MAGSPKRDEMPSLRFLGLAMRDILHHRSRIVGSILGTVIAISFITASVISVDTISGNYFKTKMEEQSSHYSLYKEYSYDRYDDYDAGIPTLDVDKYADEALKLEGIAVVKGFARSNFQFNNGSHYIDIMGITNGTERSYFGRDIVLPTEAFDVIIPTAMAVSMDLTMGDSFNLSYWNFNYDKWRWTDKLDDMGPTLTNYTFTVHGIADEVGTDLSSGPYGFYTIVTGTVGLRAFIASFFNESNSFPNAFSQWMEISISPGYLKDLDDPDATQSDVKRLTREIGTAVEDGDYRMGSNIVQDIYSNYITWSWTMRILFVILTIPLLLISFYLLSAGSRVGMEERIREIGLLKIKGASRGQVVAILMMESFIYGLIGGTLGLLLGSAMSSVFNARIFGLDPFRDILHGDLPLPSLPLVLFAFIGVPLIILLMRIAITRRISKLPLLESLGRANVAEAEKTYKPLRDVILLTVTSLIIGLMFYFNIRTPTGFFGRLVYSLLFIISPLTVLFIPFIFILTLSRLLILGFDLTLDLLSSTGKLIVKDLYPVVRANMHFHRKRIATLTILVTAVIAFGILISSMHASRLENVERSVNASIPTDLMVIEDGAAGHNRDNISAIEGVGSIVEVDSYSWVSIGSSEMWMYGCRLVAFDSANYTKSIDPPHGIVMEGKGPEGLLSSGVVPILVNDALRYNIGLSVGDRLHIGTMETPLGGKTYSIDVVVVGIISYLPGGRSTIGYGVYQDPDPNLDLQDTDEYEGMYMDIGKLPANFSASVMRSYLVDIGGDEDKMIDSINGMAWNGTSHLVLSRSDETKRIREDTAFKSIEMLLDMEYAFVIVAVTAGVLLFMIVSTASRRREFAELIARGCTRGHVLRLVLTEGAVVLAAGLVLGTIIGMVIAFSFQHLYTENLFQNLPSVGGDSDNGRTVDLGNSIVFPPTILLLHVLTVISVLGASLLTSWLASKVDIASSLRLRTS